MSYSKYFVIWIWLIALLVVSTFFSYLPLSKFNIILLILAVSLVKIGLVAFFYMHLKSERVPVWIVAVFPFFLIGIAALLVFLGTTFTG